MMMSSLVNLSISLLIPLSTGYVVLLSLFWNQPLPLTLKIALAYGLGFGILSIWMLCLGIFQQNFNLFSIGAPLIIVSCILLWQLKGKMHALPINTPVLSRKGRPQHGIMRILKSTLMALLIIFIAQNIIYVFWRSMNVPISTWDAIATIAFKAKIFFFERSLPPLDMLPHKTYPLLVPFLESWIAFNLGYWDEVLVKIIFPCAFLSYLTIHYKFLAHFTDRTWALLGCAILLSSNFFIYHATISYRDFFLMYFNCIAIMLLLFWNQSKSGPFLLLAALFAGFATFTKLEGSSFLCIYTVLFLIINFPLNSFPMKEKLTNCLKFFLPSFGIALTYHGYKIWNNVLKEGAGNLDKTGMDFTWEKINLIPGILETFSQNLFYSGNWGIVWFLVLVSLYQLKNKKSTTEVRLVLLSIVLFFGLYLSVALLTVNYVWIAGENSSTSLSRLFLHFYPLSALLIILLNHPGPSTGE